MTDKFNEVIEYFIDYTLTGEKNKLEEFIKKLSTLRAEEIPDKSYCVATSKNITPDSKYCFLGQIMSHQYRNFFTTCSGCPFFIGKDLLDAIKQYVAGDSAALSKILHEAEERKNMYIVNYYKNIP